MLPCSKQSGPLYAMHSRLWVGRAVSKDGQTGHVKTVSYRDPSHGMQHVCTVQWDDAPHQPEDILAEALVPYLLPVLVGNPVVVPSKITKQQQAKTGKNNSRSTQQHNQTNKESTDVVRFCATTSNASQSPGHSSKQYVQHRLQAVTALDDASQAYSSCEEDYAGQVHQHIIIAGKKRRSRNRRRRNKANPPAEQLQANPCDLADLPAAWLRCLVQQHLGVADRLHLFQTSKATAAAIMHHTTSATLSIARKPRIKTQHHSKTAGSVLDITTSLVSSAQNNLHLQLGKHTFYHPMPKMLFKHLPKHNVTQLSFSGMVLKVKQLMQLKAFNNLILLILGPNVQFISRNSEDMAQLADIDSWLPSRCTKLQIFNQVTHSCVQHLVPMLAPRITHLVIDSFGNDDDKQLIKLVADQLPGFTALTHISVPWGLKVGEPLLRALLPLSTVTHVAAERLEPPTPVPDSTEEEEVPLSPLRNIRWQQLLMSRWCGIDGLMQLPLDSIRQVIIQGQLYPKVRWPAVLNENHIAHLAKCQHLQLLPGTYTTEGYRWQAGHEQHSLEELSLRMVWFEELYTLAYVQVCVRNLVGGVMFDRLGECGRHGVCVADLVACLPPTVDTVSLSHATLLGDRDRTCQQVAAALPVHVKKLVMIHPGDGRELCRNAALIAKYLAVTGHPAVLYVLMSSHQQVLPELQLAVSAYSNRVRVIIGESRIEWSPVPSIPQYGCPGTWQS